MYPLKLYEKTEIMSLPIKRRPVRFAGRFSKFFGRNVYAIAPFLVFPVLFAVLVPRSSVKETRPKIKKSCRYIM